MLMMCRYRREELRGPILRKAMKNLLAFVCVVIIWTPAFG
jgi:hypothetical protein